jgi:phosphoribosylformimino-5-aminoimidazole carboxamide ribonucleotide (ProFAR) isomerase
MTVGTKKRMIPSDVNQARIEMNNATQRFFEYVDQHDDLKLVELKAAMDTAKSNFSAELNLLQQIDKVNWGS